VTYFDDTLTLDPITEQQSTPILPEERHIFELVGFERSEPDQWRKEGGIKWTFNVYDENGRPFEFKDEQYQFYRTTNVDKKTLKPLFTVGYSANDWASALLGRTLGVDANFSVSELRGKRMSAMVVWERQKQDKTKWSVKLSSLRHVPVAPLGTPSRAQVSADPSSEDVDRALAVSRFEKKLERAKKKNIPGLQTFTDAYAAIDQAARLQIEAWIENIDDEIDALDD
jgi:hypothetical protein